MKRTILSSTFSVFVVTLAVVLSSCDPSKALDKTFASWGLTRLRLLQTGVDPGRVVLRKGGQTFMKDHIAEYLSGDSETLETEFINKSKETKNIIDKIDGSSNIEPSAALSFLASLAPLDPSADFKFTSKVSIKQMNCRVRKVNAMTIRTFLKDPDHKELRDAFKQYLNDGNDVFIVSEVWTSSSIDMSSETGTDITTSLGLNKSRLIAKGDVKLTVNRTRKESVSVNGDEQYAFAVKVVKVKLDKDVLDLVETPDFVPPDATKAPGDAYTFARDDMQGIDLSTPSR